MEGDRFDQLTKRFATRRTSRRRVVTGLTGGLASAALGALAAAPAADAFTCRQPGVLCAKDAQCCSETCSEDHRCACPDGSPLCGRDCCTSPDTCGGGGTPGVCGCTPATSCPDEQTCGTASDGCGGTIDCGTCSDTTPVCSNSGTCVCTATSCDDDTSCCRGTCTTLDPTTCSGPSDCASGFVCINGGCFRHGTCAGTCTAICTSTYITVTNGPYCLDAGTTIGQCANDDDCPAGTLCSPYPSSNPSKPHLCTRPCTFPQA